MWLWAQSGLRQLQGFGGRDGSWPAAEPAPHPILILPRSCPTPTPTPRLLRPLDVLGPARTTKSAATAMSQVRQDQPHSVSGSGVTCAPFAWLCSGEACPTPLPWPATARHRLIFLTCRARPTCTPSPAGETCSSPMPARQRLWGTPGCPAPLPASSCTPWLDWQL